MGKNKHVKGSKKPKYTEDLSSFSVYNRADVLGVGIFFTAFFVGFAVLGFYRMAKEGNTESWLIFSCLGMLACSYFGIDLILRYKFERLDVKGENLTYTNRYGKRREIKSYEIRHAEFKYHGLTASLFTYDQNGDKLFCVSSDMANYKRMIEYLLRRESQLSTGRRKSWLERLFK